MGAGSSAGPGRGTDPGTPIVMEIAARIRARAARGGNRMDKGTSDRRGLAHRVADEVVSVGVTTAVFAAWFLALLGLKTLVLEEYQIRFYGVATALVGAVVAAKVVIVLEHVPLLGPVERAPAWVQVVTRTALYTLAVLAAAALERAFETRAEHGGFGPALADLVQRSHWPHLATTAAGVGSVLLLYNAMAVVRRHVGPAGLRRMFTEPLPVDDGSLPVAGASSPRTAAR